MMMQEKIIQRAKRTAKKLRQKERANGDPICNEAYKSIMALIGLMNIEQCK